MTQFTEPVITDEPAVVGLGRDDECNTVYWGETQHVVTLLSHIKRRC